MRCKLHFNDENKTMITRKFYCREFLTNAYISAALALNPISIQYSDIINHEYFGIVPNRNMGYLLKSFANCVGITPAITTITCGKWQETYYNNFISLMNDTFFKGIDFKLFYGKTSFGDDAIFFPVADICPSKEFVSFLALLPYFLYTIVKRKVPTVKEVFTKMAKSGLPLFRYSSQRVNYMLYFQYILDEPKNIFNHVWTGQQNGPNSFMYLLRHYDKVTYERTAHNLHSAEYFESFPENIKREIINLI